MRLKNALRLNWRTRAIDVTAESQRVETVADLKRLLDGMDDDMPLAFEDGAGKFAPHVELRLLVEDDGLGWTDPRRPDDAGVRQVLVFF